MKTRDTKHILIAEDTPDDQVLLKRALERVKKECPDFTYVIVENGLEARRYLERKESYSDEEKYPIAALILSDIKMPVMDGFELLSWVRDHKAMAKLPVVLFSTSNMKKDVERAYDLGANTFFTKPHSPAQLEQWAKTFAEYWCKLAATPDAT
jgi:CheY-like chemotaxis protein